MWTQSSLARSELDLQLCVPVQPDIGEAGAPIRTLRTRACVVTLRSTGTVYRLLAHRDDRQRPREAVPLTRRIMALPPIARMIDRELNADAGETIPARIDEAIDPGAMSFHHGTSTVPMGGEDDPTAVVGASGRVGSIDGVRWRNGSPLSSVPGNSPTKPMHQGFDPRMR